MWSAQIKENLWILDIKFSEVRKKRILREREREREREGERVCEFFI